MVQPGAQDLLIGRADDADFEISSPHVGRRHARVSWGEEGPRIEDLSSTNGTQVNGRMANMALAFTAGDTIRMGAEVIRVVGHHDAPKPAKAGQAVSDTSFDFSLEEPGNITISTGDEQLWLRFEQADTHVTLKVQRFMAGKQRIKATVLLKRAQAEDLYKLLLDYVSYPANPGGTTGVSGSIVFDVPCRSLRLHADSGLGHTSGHGLAYNVHEWARDVLSEAI